MRNIIYLHRYKREFSNTSVTEKIKWRKKRRNRRGLCFVHGVCHGAWCWYKIIPHLEAAGHSVVAVDLAASGISTVKVEEIQSLEDYSKPLLEVLSSIDDDEQVIIVAHSMGGIPAALAADISPSKIACIVFMTATMPDTKNPPSYPFEKASLLSL